MIRFILNDKEVTTDLPPGTLLLDYIRYYRHLSGTKIGCREGDCGACTVLVGEIRKGELVYASATCCLMALANAQGKHIVTIEGINGTGLNTIQKAMNEESATQCGFCTPGFVVSLAGFCLNNTERSSAAAIASISGNICRCTGYKSIERAAIKVAAFLQQKGDEPLMDFLTANEVLPAYFTTIKSRLQQFATHGQQAGSGGKRFLGGGTDLYVQQPEAMTQAEMASLFLKQELRGIRQEGNRCLVGGAATVTDILTSSLFQHYFSQLNKFIKLVSSTPIRNMATVGGNLVNASPIGDLTIFFLALDAGIVLSNGERERVVPLKNFYKGYKQLDKQPEDYIKEIFFELPANNTKFNFEKVCKRTHLDIASVNTAVKIVMGDGVMDSVHISAGGGGPVPMYLERTSASLNGRVISEETILEAIAIAQTEISPISDVRGSEAYKRLLLSQLLKAHFIQLFPQLSFDKLLHT